MKILSLRPLAVTLLAASLALLACAVSNTERLHQKQREKQTLTGADQGG